jgi:Mn2+/Fe2+ NRAMP family transporter
MSEMVKISSVADGLGIAASVACALHCLLVPLWLLTGAALPVSMFTDESFHMVMVLMILPVAIVAFGMGCRRHKDKWVLGLGLVGVAGLLLAAFVLHDLLGESGERFVTLLSATLLIAAHYRNFTLCRSFDGSRETA